LSEVVALEEVGKLCRRLDWTRAPHLEGNADRENRNDRDDSCQRGSHDLPLNGRRAMVITLPPRSAPKISAPFR